MRTYRIHYYAEHSDECFDFDIDIQANTITDAMLVFYQGPTVFKRVWRVEELPLRQK